MDLGIFTNVAAQGETQLGLELGKSGYSVAGIEKAVQLFVTFFLTELGSNAADSEFGTTFLYSLRAGYMTTAADISAEFSIAVTDLMNYNQKNGINDNSNPDEVMTSITLLSQEIVWDKSLLKLYVGIAVRSGASRKIVLPVTMVAT